MPHLDRRAGPAVLAGALLALAIVRPGAPPAAGAAAPPEIRALWVQRTSLTSPERIAALVEAARANGFDTLLVQVRGRGDAFYASALAPRAAQLAAQPASFDPLAATLAAARAAGLRVHAWVNLALVASATYLPADRSHLIYRHPEWLMVPRALAERMAALDPQSPAYTGTLARWTRGRSGDVEGLYASPAHPGFAAHVEALLAELTARYALDGVHLDYVRYPSQDFDYSREAIGAFRAEIAPGLPPVERHRLDARQRVDLFAYPDTFPERWARFRRSRLSALVMRARTAVKTRQPNALVTAAVRPDQADAFTHRFQDWRLWVDNGFLDAICPMAYTEDLAVFADQIGAAARVAGGARVWAGIGAYRLTPGRTVEYIRTARRQGAAGIVLFSYDNLIDPAQHRTDYLAEVGRHAFVAGADAAGGSR